MARTGFITSINKDNASYTIKAIQAAQRYIHDLNDRYPDNGFTQEQWNSAFIARLAYIINCDDPENECK
jgi:hypothetical protein